MRYRLFHAISITCWDVRLCCRTCANIMYHDGFAWVFPYDLECFLMGVLWFLSRLACFEWIHKFTDAEHVYLAI